MRATNASDVFGLTKQSAAHILAPLVNAKLVKRLGTRRNGRYVLA